MANDCSYTMKAVAKNKEALERLISIMRYKDKEFYIYRCFEASAQDIETEVWNNETYYTVMIDGDVAWSCVHWFETTEDFSRTEEDTGAHYITLDLICKKLSIGMEVYSEEPGMEFQEYYLVNHEGEVAINDCVDWSMVDVDDNGNELNEPEEYGGFDDYCVFDNANYIY